MANQGTSEKSVSSGGDPLDNLDPALADMTDDLIPGYSNDIQNVDAVELETILAQLVATALVTPLKDKALAQMLGKMAIVMSAQSKHTHKLLAQSTAAQKSALQENRALKQQLESTQQLLNEAQECITELQAPRTSQSDDEDDEEKSELKGKNSQLEHLLHQKEQELEITKSKLNDTTKTLGQSETLLKQAAGEIKDLKSQVKVHSKHREAEQKRTHDMQKQLGEARDRIAQSLRQQEIKEEELADARREFQLSLEIGQHTNSFLQPLPERDRPRSPLPDLEDWSSQPLPLIPTDHMTEPQVRRPPPAQVKTTHLPRPRPPPATDHSLSPSDRDLDKIARHITRFQPSAGGSNETNIYLKDIDYYLRKFPAATVDDKIYLIKVTSSREVSSFIERQPRYVREDYDILCQTLVEEYSDLGSQAGLAAAIAVKQERSEPPQQYYHRLRQAYFGTKNEPEMEEEVNFKCLFIQNLHPTTSHHLGVAACPRTQTSRQLRELATKGFEKQRHTMTRHSEPRGVLNVNVKSPHMELEGASGGEPPASATHPSQAPQPTQDQRHAPPRRPEQRWGHSRPPWADKNQNYQKSEFHRPMHTANRWGNRPFHERGGRYNQRESQNISSWNRRSQENTRPRFPNKDKKKDDTEGKSDAPALSGEELKTLKRWLQTLP